MLDIHSHILPKFDDGSKSSEMSLEMLRKSAEQGVTTIVSTSHFYADSEDPAHFLARRAAARDHLRPKLTGGEPDILYGAEVLYYPGLSHSSEIASLAIEGTSLILIELPFVSWSENLFDELLTFQYHTKLHIVLAHVERYQDIQKRGVYDRLFEQPFYFQCNAEAFAYRRSRKLAMKLLDSGRLHFLGTDCHNTTDRAPNMDEARKVIEKKYSPAAWQQFCAECEDRFNRHRLDREEDPSPIAELYDLF
jgi:protein-tyrosine phosphatase